MSSIFAIGYFHTELTVIPWQWHWKLTGVIYLLYSSECAPMVSGPRVLTPAQLRPAPPSFLSLSPSEVM